MEEPIIGTTENQNANDQVDPWEAAFAALNKVDEVDSEGAAGSGGDGGDGAGGAVEDTAKADGQQDVSDNAETVDGAQDEGVAGGPGDDVGVDLQQDGTAFQDVLGVSEEDVEKFRADIQESSRNRAIEEIAAEFVKRGVRNRNGQLGATIEDADICKRDSDGVPRFYNPETGREFTGDNPRRQAKEWVDDYNKELARVFNEACAQYESKLVEEESPKLKVMEFAPKYEKLDPIRKGMFDNVIQDYEIEEDGKVVGYSCDLDKALALVDRQVAMIQNYAKEHQNKQANKPTGPVLDMKTSSGAVQATDQSAPTSLAEAMERKQDELLANLKK